MMISLVEFIALIIIVSFILIFVIGAFSVDTVKTNKFKILGPDGSVITLKKTGVGQAEDSNGNRYTKNTDDTWSLDKS